MQVGRCNPWVCWSMVVGACQDHVRMLVYSSEWDEYCLN